MDRTCFAPAYFDRAGFRYSTPNRSSKQRCQKAKVKFNLVLQSNFVPLIHQAVVDGLGAATLLRSLVEEDPRIAALSFNPPEVFKFSLCWRDGHSLSKANQAFVSFALGRYHGVTR
jgi:DNA-binding transcriptional LysR family regulator